MKAGYAGAAVPVVVSRAGQQAGVIAQWRFLIARSAGAALLLASLVLTGCKTANVGHANASEPLDNMKLPPGEGPVAMT